MCDCYTDKCRICGEEVEMHLSDYNTGRDEVEVYCVVHMPEERRDGVTWRCRDSGREPWRKVFVRWLTDNARENASGNYPNMMHLESNMCPDGVLAVFDDKDVLFSL